jgi:hypothetical protein
MSFRRILVGASALVVGALALGLIGAVPTWLSGAVIVVVAAAATAVEVVRERSASGTDAAPEGPRESRRLYKAAAVVLLAWAVVAIGLAVPGALEIAPVRVIVVVSLGVGAVATGLFLALSWVR